MLYSILNLLAQAFTLAVKDTVTWTVAIGGGLSLFVLKQIRVWRSKGFEAMKENRKKDAGYSFLLTAGLSLCLFLTFVLKTVYDDRRSILMEAHAAEVARDTYKQVLSDRDATIEQMEKNAKDSCRPHTPHSATPSTRRKARSSGTEK